MMNARRAIRVAGRAAWRWRGRRSRRPMQGLPRGRVRACGSARRGRSCARRPGLEGGEAGVCLSPFCQPFVRRPARQGLLGRRCGGTPFVPTPPLRHGAQRRARAALLGAGTAAARSHAQARLRAEHGEHGEDPPLTRSEHRGTHAGYPQARSCPQRKSSISS